MAFSTWLGCWNFDLIRSCRLLEILNLQSWLLLTCSIVVVFCWKYFQDVKRRCMCMTCHWMIIFYSASCGNWQFLICYAPYILTFFALCSLKIAHQTRYIIKGVLKVFRVRWVRFFKFCRRKPINQRSTFVNEVIRPVIIYNILQATWTNEWQSCRVLYAT